MAILNITVDTDDIDEDTSFESLFRHELSRKITEDLKKKFTEEEFSKFSKAVENTVESQVKAKMESFLSEDITITSEWGKKTFVGSIEDYIRHKYDSVILAPVDASGKMLNGCTSGAKTWVQWSIEQATSAGVKNLVEEAAGHIKKAVCQEVNKQLSDIMNRAIKDKVSASLQGFLAK